VLAGPETNQLVFMQDHITTWRSHTGQIPDPHNFGVHPRVSDMVEKLSHWFRSIPQVHLDDCLYELEQHRPADYNASEQPTRLFITPPQLSSYMNWPSTKAMAAPPVDSHVPWSFHVAPSDGFTAMVTEQTPGILNWNTVASHEHHLALLESSTASILSMPSKEQLDDDDLGPPDPYPEGRPVMTELVKIKEYKLKGIIKNMGDCNSVRDGYLQLNNKTGKLVGTLNLLDFPKSPKQQRVLAGQLFDAILDFDNIIENPHQKRGPSIQSIRKRSAINEG
jgi:hypothetical protein